MPRTQANYEKTAGARENAARPGLLHWDVFVTNVIADTFV
jgi:hypothetical protein